MNTEHSNSKLSKEIVAHFSRRVFSRRKFLQVMGVSVGAAVLSSLSPESTYGAPSAAELLPTSENSAAKILSVQELEGVDSNGELYLYREYHVEYETELFVVHARVLNSETNHILHHYFNGSGVSEVKNREVLQLIFNASSEIAHQLTKASVYVLSAYHDSDPDSAKLALQSEFYTASMNVDSNQASHQIREDWTVAQFAQAFNPRSLHSLSDACGIESYNILKQSNGEPELLDTTVIITNDFNSGAIGFAFDPGADFLSDKGAIYNPTARSATAQSMHELMSTHVHEVGGHGTADNWLYYSNSRDQLSESQAEMCQAAFLYEMGDLESSQYKYDTALQQIFSMNPETKMYNFTGYTALVFASLVAPYFDVMAQALHGGVVGVRETAINLKTLNDCNKDYLNLRNIMITEMGSEWYYAWRQAFTTAAFEEGKPPNRMILAHHDALAPVIYAEYLVSGRDPLADKDGFMQEVLERAVTEPFETRKKILSDTFNNESLQSLPYFSDVFRDRCNVIVSSDDQFTIAESLPQPAVGSTVTITRKVDPVYQEVDIATKDEYYLRNFYAYYSINKLLKANDGEEYVIKKKISDDEFSVTVIVPEYSSAHRLVGYKREILRTGQELVVGLDSKAIVCVVDLRKDQIVDDLAGVETEIYDLSARKREVKSKTVRLPFLGR